MFCRNCGVEFDDKNSVCPKCGWDNTKEMKNDNNQTCARYNDGFVSQSSFDAFMKIAFFIAAVAVVIICFSAASEIDIASSNMTSLRSVSGTSVNEAYYNYYGRFISGIAGAVRAMGVTFGGALIYLAHKY